MVHYTERVTEPCAYITKGRQRLKQYGSTVYLNNKEEFEIELFNPTTSKVLAEILIDGKSITPNSGLVLRPGERYFLERYLNEARKFLFETYEVDGSDSNVQRAIANNGKVEIKFYQQQQPLALYNTGTCWTVTTWPTWPTTNNPYYYNYHNTITDATYGYSTPTSGGNRSFGSSRIQEKKSKSFDNNTQFLCSASLGVNDNANAYMSFADMPVAAAAPAPMETGRVEKGGYSNQRFTTDETQFNSWYSWRTEWQILPMSRKPVETRDVKVFCTKCGAKQKRHTHKFCPNCGTPYAQ